MEKAISSFRELNNKQDEIIDNDVKKANLAFKSIDDIPTIIRGLNKLTEELK